MSAEQFLTRYYRDRERRASPRSLSEERGSFAAAVGGELWWSWACRVHGAAMAGQPAVVGVALEAYFLRLTPAHESMVRRRGATAIEHLTPGQPRPPADGDLKSYVSWPAMAKATGVEERVLVDAWRAGRLAVAQAMDDLPLEAFERFHREAEAAAG